MTARQLEQQALTIDDVIDWRFEQLVEAGYPPHKAWMLAEHRHVDLHQAVELLKRDCPAELALSILL